MNSSESKTAKPRLKTVYCIRIRADESQTWSDPCYYRKRSERDREGSVARIIAGFRTHSYEEKKTPDEIDQLCD